MSSSEGGNSALTHEKAITREQKR